MAGCNIFRGIFCPFLAPIFFLSFSSFSQGQMVPAVFVFGDSLVDVGNNNHLRLSIVRADFPHNGVDFPTKKPTGRFSNGKNAADFIAEKVGLPTSPPYLSLKSKKNNNASFLTGVSFASGGAGIFNGSDEALLKLLRGLWVVQLPWSATSLVDHDTYILGPLFNTDRLPSGPMLKRQSIPLTKQVEMYSKVHEELLKQLGSSAQQHFSKSLFAIVIGSNDLLGYFGSSDLREKSTPQQYVNLMVSTLKGQLKRLYDHGARKFVVAGLGVIGCSPSQRIQNQSEECNEEANYWSVKYNNGVKSLLQESKSELKGMAYSYFDTYGVMQNIIQNAAVRGFTETKSACCGLGKLKARIPCIPIATYCANRNDHVFWDLYHPTEAIARIFVDTIFDGPSQYTFPINMRHLVAV